jgi:UDP-glucuronate 4-epimerase
LRILVTGAAGFIGNELSLKLLAAGHDVLGLDGMTDYYDVQLKRDRLARLAAPFEFVEARLENRAIIYDAFDRFAPERVYHCAAQAGVRHSLEHPEDYIDANITGTFNVLEACRRTDVRHLLIASTSSAYGAHDVFPFVETASVPHPLTIYAASKLAGELMAHTYAHLHNLPATMMRFFSVYGPWGRSFCSRRKF